MNTDQSPSRPSAAAPARGPWPAWIPLVGLIGFAGWFAFSAINVMRKVKLPLWERYRDFYEFYSGADAFNHGISPYLASVGKIGYIYPPLLAFLMQPLAKLELSVAGPLWLGMNLVMLGLALWLGARDILARLNQRTDVRIVLSIMLVAIIVMCDKVRSDLNMGQTQSLLLLCWMLALVWMDRHPWLAGLAIGLSANIKYVTIIALPYFAIRRRWSALLASIIFTIAWAILPAAQIGWQTNQTYLTEAFQGLIRLVDPEAVKTDAARILPLSGGLSCSITSMSVRMLGRDVPADIARHGEGADRAFTPAAGALVVGVMLVLAATVFWMYRRAGVALFGPAPLAKDPHDPRRVLTAMEWAGLLVFVLAFSPQTNMRHLSLLLPAAICMAGMMFVQGQPHIRRLAITGAALLFFALIFPPGDWVSMKASQSWRDAAGPIWCVLVGGLLGLWSGLLYVRQVRRDQASPRLPSAP